MNVGTQRTSGMSTTTFCAGRVSADDGKIADAGARMVDAVSAGDDGSAWAHVDQIAQRWVTVPGASAVDHDG